MQVPNPSTPSVRVPTWESPRAVGGSQGGFIFEDSPLSVGESKDDKLSPGPGGMRGGVSGDLHGFCVTMSYNIMFTLSYLAVLLMFFCIRCFFVGKVSFTIYPIVRNFFSRQHDVVETQMYAFSF